MRLQCVKAGYPADEDGDWKPRREIQYKDKLQAFAAPLVVSTLNGDDWCICCLRAFDNVDTKPLSLACDPRGRHNVCQDCFQLWYVSRGPVNASCPHCRALLFPKQSTIDALKFGIDEADGKTYLPDQRYNNFENF